MYTYRGRPARHTIRTRAYRGRPARRTIWTRVSQCAVLCLLLVFHASAAEPCARAILIGGSGGETAYTRNIADWVQRFNHVLTKQCGLKQEDVLVLLDPVPNGVPGTIKNSTLENVKAAFESMKKNLGPADQFILFLAGHGQVTEPVGKLCLPGADLASDMLAPWLDGLPTQNIVIINTASGGAPFTKACSKAGRVLISAAGVEADANQTYFAEFYLRGYEDKRADADKNGAIDLLEAYLYAAHETANWYHRQYLSGSQKKRAWMVKGKETRALWAKLYAGSNEHLAKPIDPNDPDTEPIFGDFGPEWHDRRVLAEHAQLKDTAGEEGFILWKPYEFEKPPPAGPGQLGNLAKRTLLGQPVAR